MATKRKRRRKSVNVLSSDVGRRLTDLRHDAEMPGLEDLVGSVMKC